MEERIEAFDPIFWNLHLDCVEVDEEGQLNYHFRNGTTITISSRKPPSFEIILSGFLSVYFDKMNLDSHIRVIFSVPLTYLYAP